ncbi:unnamed protein product, partial [Staurois parvus]
MMGTSGRNWWVALLGTGHQGTDHQCPDDRCRSLLSAVLSSRDHQGTDDQCPDDRCPAVPPASSTHLCPAVRPLDLPTCAQQITHLCPAVHPPVP